MKRKILLVSSLSLLAVLSIGLFWLTPKDVAQAENVPHPLESINQKAKDARDGNLTDAKDLVGEVIRVAGFEGELAGFATTAIKERVGNAESRYRLGQTAGVPEAKIVRTINGLARRLNLPAFARTNQYEVRKLRLELLPNFPELITQKTQGLQPIAVGAGLEPQMSPAEAFLIFSLMVQQKLNNREYQMTRAERTSRWNEKHHHQPGQTPSLNPFPNRNREMKEAIRQGIASASNSDVMQLSDVTLNTLGIEQ